MKLKVLLDSPKLIRVALSGTMDLMGNDNLETKLSALMVGNEQDTIMDVSDVSYINSDGIGLLITVSNLVKRGGGKFVLLKPQPVVAKVLQLSKLSAMLGVAVDEATAQSMLLGESG